MDRNKIQSNIMCGIVSAALASGVTYGLISHSNSNSIRGMYTDLEKLAECREIIDENASESFNVDEAINGYLTSGLDKYTKIIKDPNSDRNEEITSYVNTSGTAFASGFQIALSASGNILLTNVESGKAADKCGLKTNDEIIVIAGKKVKDEGYSNIANKLLGKQDTEVELTVERDGAEYVIVFKRDNVYLRDVEWKKYSDVGYIRIKDFGLLCESDLSSAAKELADCKKYVIDLRQNYGGETDICINLLSFIAPGSKVTLYPKNGEQTVKTANENKDVLKGRFVVLIDEATASASEIMASAIKQYTDNAVLIGSKTYGKGVFQNKVKLDSGDYLTYTAGYFTVGGWECWQGKGIEPDVEIEMDSALIGTNDDAQLKEALKLLD